jgi:hypothetical protein
MRLRVKRARALVATTPGLAEILASDWRKAARFYAGFGITETQLRHGVPETSLTSDPGHAEHSVRRGSSTRVYLSLGPPEWRRL